MPSYHQIGKINFPVGGGAGGYMQGTATWRIGPQINEPEGSVLIEGNWEATRKQ